MHVAVIGAGVVGVTSAYFLARAGCRVSLFERAETPAAATSQANGGQLAYSFVDAMARPSFLLKLPGIVSGRDAGSSVALRGNAALASWGLQFLRECTPERARRNTIALLELGQRSAECLESLVQETGVEFGWVKRGKLVLLATQDLIASQRAGIDMKARYGCESKLLSMAEASVIEPALEAFAADYTAAVFTPGDAHGDARKFTTQLAEWLAAQADVQSYFRADVQRVVLRNGRVAAVATTDGEQAVDAVLVCAGATSGELLRELGIAAPIYPVRGYSLTLPPGQATPAISITDLARRFVMCPLGDKVRIAGYADFVGHHERGAAERAAQLADVAKSVAPDAADFSAPGSAWTGMRPMTPSGRPLLGPTRVPGLYLNCGHGMLGWTLAAGSGDAAARMIASVAPAATASARGTA